MKKLVPILLGVAAVACADATAPRSELQLAKAKSAKAVGDTVWFEWCEERYIDGHWMLYCYRSPCIVGQDPRCAEPE